MNFLGHAFLMRAKALSALHFWMELRWMHHTIRGIPEIPKIRLNFFCHISKDIQCIDIAVPTQYPNAESVVNAVLCQLSKNHSGKADCDIWELDILMPQQ